jgi:hypothetical protein
MPSNIFVVERSVEKTRQGGSEEAHVLFGSHVSTLREIRPSGEKRREDENVRYRAQK